MIKVTSENKYKVMKPELFKSGSKLLGKYPLWLNDAMKPNHICFVKGFGEGWGGFSMNEVWFGFNPKTNTLKLNCSSMEGMCGFTFNEEDLENTKLGNVKSEFGKNMDKVDIECMEFTINLIKELLKEKIISED